MLSSFGEVARDFFTAFCKSLCKDVSLVGVRLKLEVFWSSRLLKNAYNFKPKVSVRFKLECGLI